MDLWYGEHNFWHGRLGPAWIAITYVCRYWRSAALNLHEIWSSITPDLSISWSQVMIERSASLPMRIVVIMMGYPGNFLKYFSASKLLLSACRIRTLTLFGLTSDVLGILNSLCSPSPIESLTIWADNYVHRGMPVNLPESMYGGDAPHLRYLTFDAGEYIRAPLWLLAGITHFTHNMCISLYELIDTLEAMPRLEVVCVAKHVDPYDPVGPHNPPPPPRTITLPHLSLLSIRDSIPGSFFALSSCIKGPPTLRRHFFWSVDSETWLKWAWTVTVLQDFIPVDSAPGANDGGLRIAQICRREYGTFEMWSRTYSEKASTAAREDALFLWHVDWSDWSDRGPINFSFPNPSTVFSRVAYIEDLTITPETAIKGAYNAIANTIEAPITIERLMELLTNLTSVKTLRLHRGTHACVSILRALSSSKDPILPHLQRVIVINSAIDSGASARPNGVGGAGAGCSVASRKFVQPNVGAELAEAVSWRSGLEVVLAGCEVDEKTLDALRKEARVYIGHERVYV